MKKNLLAVVLLSGTAAPCSLNPVHAASIEVNQSTVTIDGAIEFGDFEVFKSKTRFLSQATVVLRSDGGNLVPAIKIGELIRLKGFATYVQDYCASACTLIWIGGTQRYMYAAARIGFHAAYNGDTGQEAGMANAVVGAYLTKLGLPYEAVMYATVAGPSDMRWLTAADAKRVGIDVSVINPEPTFGQNPKPTFGQNPQPALKQLTLKEQALFFMSYYFANWNSNYYPQVFDELYWESANYYGQMASKQEILNDKLKAIGLWPVRAYKLRSAAATCGLTECNVTGIVDWEVSNQTTHAVGAATFEYILRPWPLGGAGTDDKLRISAENGKVLQQQITDKCDSAKFPSLCPSP